MHFDVKTAEPGKAYDIVAWLVAPRPIALVTTMDGAGQIDAAPYSPR